MKLPTQFKITLEPLRVIVIAPGDGEATTTLKLHAVSKVVVSVLVTDATQKTTLVPTGNGPGVAGLHVSLTGPRPQ